jgi:hypothetical protein
MTWFQCFSAWSVLTLSLCATLANSAPPSLPQRNLVIEWRQIDDSETTSTPAARLNTTLSSSGAQINASSGTTVSTQRRSDSQAFNQQLRVLNGGRATMRINHRVPVTWVEAAQIQTSTAVGYGSPTPPPRAGAAVVQGLAWLDAGRQITFQARWPGGDQPAVVDIHVDSAALENERPTIAAMNSGGAALPVQTRSQTVTTVLAPLGQWVTIARTGGETNVAQRGVVSTTTSTTPQHQLMQIRVVVP